MTSQRSFIRAHPGTRSVGRYWAVTVPLDIGVLAFGGVAARTVFALAVPHDLWFDRR